MRTEGLTTIPLALYGVVIFLVGFFLFIALYIILRLLAEKHEHKDYKHDSESKLKKQNNEQK
jgi:hypothetical protein